MSMTRLGEEMILGLQLTIPGEEVRRLLEGWSSIAERIGDRGAASEAR